MRNTELASSLKNLVIADDFCSSYFYDQQYKVDFTEEDREQFNKSAIDPEVAELNIWRITHIPYIKHKLNNPGINCGGLVFQPVQLNNEADTYICFKPDTPKIDKKTGKPNKYLNTHQKNLDTKSHRTKGPVFLRWSVSAFAKLCDRYPEEFADVTFEYDPQSREVFGVWEYIINETKIPLYLTEGDKKTLCLISIGIPAMSIRGCQMGDFEWDGKHIRIYPGKFWEEHFSDQRDRILYVILDGDDETNQNVAQGKVKFLCLQTYYGMTIKDFDWSNWEEKKIDDLIEKHGVAGFEKFSEKSRLLAKWVSTHKQEWVITSKVKHSLDILAEACKPKKDNEGNPIPLPAEKADTDGMPSGLLAKYLYSTYLQHTLRFCDTTKQFFTYGTEKNPLCLAGELSEVRGDSWRMCRASQFQRLISILCEDKNIDLPTHAYKKDMIKEIMDRAMIEEQNKSEYLGFKNGVMSLPDNVFKNQHSPKYSNQFIHNFPYKPQIVKDKQELLEQLHKKCPTIFKFLARLQEYEEYDVLRTLACIKSYVCYWLSDFQFFILIMGPEGSSKSVFLKFLSYLIDPVGFVNCRKSRIVGGIAPQDLSDRQMLFDLLVCTSAIHIPEVKKLSADMQDTIKKLAAQDEFTVRSHHQESQRVQYFGNLVIVSNGDPFFYLELQGINRRKIIFNFENPVKKSEKITGFEKKLVAEVPAFLNLILPPENLSKEECQAYLDNISDKDQHYNLIGASNNEEKPIDNMIINQLVPCPGNIIKVKEIYNRLQILNPDDKYIKGLTPANFSRAMKTTLKKYTQFGWENIEYYRADQYKEIGLVENTTALGNCRLREPDDIDIPTFTEASGEKRHTASKKLNITGLEIPEEYLKNTTTTPPQPEPTKQESEPITPAPAEVLPVPEPNSPPEPVEVQEIKTEVVLTPPEPTPTPPEPETEPKSNKLIEIKYPRLFEKLQGEIDDSIIPILKEIKQNKSNTELYQHLLEFPDGEELRAKLITGIKLLKG